MDDLWVPRSEVEKEKKLREIAEEKLQRVLEFLDPQIVPDSKGGLIYGAPFPNSGDLAKRVLGFVEEIEENINQFPGPANIDAYLTNLARRLRKVVGASRYPEAQTRSGIIVPDTKELGGKVVSVYGVVFEDSEP